MKWSGLFTAQITPFKDGKVDIEGLKKLLHRQKEHVDGIVMLGTTGEAATLTLDEKKQILRAARAELNNFPLMVGVGTASTETTVEMAKIAQDLGADCLLVVTPYYNKPTQEGIYLHYASIAKAVKLPIMAYSILGRAAVNIELETVLRLSEIDQIIGIKEASKNLQQITDILSQVKAKRKDFVLLSGDEALTFPIMALGGDGLISAASNVIPQKMKELISFLSYGDIIKARECHYALLPLFNALFAESNPIGVKAALSHMHLPAGDPRLPLTPLSQEKKEKLIHVLTQRAFL
jgi:4-hydroxy-tetrahydrodipicolinate synthase